MKIDGSQFGSIRIDGKTYEYDVIIRMNGAVEKRKKKLSKKLYGTSHRISLEEAQFLFQEHCPLLILGTGQYNQVSLSEEAVAFLASKHCKVYGHPTPEAIRVFNETPGPKVGLFHVTC